MIVRRFNKFFNKNYKGKVTRKPTKLSCHKCESPNHFIKECPQWDTKKGKGKFKERNKDQPKPFSKIEMKRAIIAAWGESDFKEEQEQAEEETAQLFLMAKSEDEGESSNTKVCSYYRRRLTEINKSQLVK